MDRSNAERVLASLTPAQTEVLDRVLLHKTSKQIARELDIAPNTVDQRVKAAWMKLGVKSRASAAREYARLKSICGQTTYGSAGIPKSALSVDRGTESDFDSKPPIRHLEGIDQRFGRFGRLGAILAIALVIALSAMLVLNVAITLSGLEIMR